MSICSFILKLVKPPAASKRERKDRRVASLWAPGPGSRVFDIYLVAPDHYDEAREQYASPNGMAWAYLNSNEAIILDKYWPRSARVAEGQVGFIKPERMALEFSNALQEGIYLHEVLGHAILGKSHEDPHPTMNKAENLPRSQRLDMMNTVAYHYDTLRIQRWVPGMDVHADDSED